jgi:hypothetical protein
VKSHARQACSSPRKPARPRTTCSQVSAATSSAASRRDHPQVAQQSRVAIPPQPRERRLAAPCAAASTAANPPPITGPSIGRTAARPQDFGHLPPGARHTKTTCLIAGPGP